MISNIHGSTSQYETNRSSVVVTRSAVYIQSRENEALIRCDSDNYATRSPLRQDISEFGRKHVEKFSPCFRVYGHMTRRLHSCFPRYISVL